MTSSDPAKLAEEILSKELLALSWADRNSYHEEIHGVRCLALEETPSLVEESLRKLAFELDEVIPHSEKRAYLRGQTQSKASKQYINDKNFRLTFLRCELFDAHKAAKRMAKTCECLLHLFGPYALERPIKLSDFTSAELKAFRKGRTQILPFRDRIGRRVAVLFPNMRISEVKDWTQIRRLQVRIFLYMSFVLSLDVETQRRGVVMLLWFDRMRTKNPMPFAEKWSAGIKAHSAAMVRCSALHICSPETKGFRLQWSILLLMISANNRVKVKIHNGERIELRYLLNGYGISTDTLPVSWTGTIKASDIAYLKQWMRTRDYLEDPSNRNDPSAPIECPDLNHVIFKKGTSTIHHPGNVRFRSMIQSRYEYELSRKNRAAPEQVGVHHNHNTHGDTAAATTTTTNPEDDKSIKSLLVAHVMELFQTQQLRALIWNEKMSWWNLISDERQIVKKVENAVNHFVFGHITPKDASSSSSKLQVKLHPGINVVDESLKETDTQREGGNSYGNTRDQNSAQTRKEKTKGKHHKASSFHYHPKRRHSQLNLESSTSIFQFDHQLSNGNNSRGSKWDTDGTDQSECSESHCFGRVFR
eukprot:jgi/Psemu1/211550/e_gw1.571.37.1